MQDITLNHANTFFFVTTIAVTIGIVILLVLLFMFLRILNAVRTISSRVEQMVNKTGDNMETGPAAATLKKSLPFILSIVGLFAQKKKGDKKVPKK